MGIRLTVDEYYRNRDVLYDVVKFTKNRETVLMTDNANKSHKPIRQLKVQNVDWLLKLLKAYKVVKQQMNLYYSVARVHGMPLIYKDYNGSFTKYFHVFEKGTDIVIDFDSDGSVTDFNRLEEDVRVFVNILNGAGVSNMVYFSGNKGYHVFIPFGQMSYVCSKCKTRHKTGYCQKDKDYLIHKTFSYALANMADDYGIGAYIDYSVFDCRRFAKVPNSLVWTKNKNVKKLPFVQASVVKPLDSVSPFMSVFSAKKKFRSSNIPLKGSRNNLLRLMEDFK